MSVELNTISGGNITAATDGKFYSHITNGVGGLLSGAGVTASGGLTVHINSGWGIASGRLFTVTAEDFTVTPSGGANRLGRVYIQLDLSSEPHAKILSVMGASLPDLRQDNLSTGGTIYEIELAHYNVNATTVSNLVSNTKIVTVAPRAVADSDGNNIANTYVKKADGSFNAPVTIKSNGFPRLNVVNSVSNRKLFLESRNGGYMSIGLRTDTSTGEEGIKYIVDITNADAVTYMGGSFNGGIDATGDITAPNLYSKNNYATNLCEAGVYTAGNPIQLSEAMTNFEEIEITWLLQGNGNNPVIMRYNSNDLFAGRYLVDSVYFSETMHNYVGLAYVGPARLRVNEAVGSEEWAAPTVALVRGIWRK